MLMCSHSCSLSRPRIHTSRDSDAVQAKIKAIVPRSWNLSRVVLLGLWEGRTNTPNQRRRSRSVSL